MRSSTRLAMTLLTVGAAVAAGVPAATGATAAQHGPNGVPSTSPPVPLAPCADAADFPGWVCGSIPVPFDRARPNARSISIGFAVFPHTDTSTPAAEPLFISDGGPGFAATASKGARTFMFGPLTDHRDLVLIDNRGTGTSSPIDCPALQDGVSDTQDVITSVGACGAQLGPDADRYGSGDVALDIEAVRHALGYPLIDYYGQSYGSVDQQAYAVRFPHRLRALVLDAGLPVNDPQHVWAWGLGEGAAQARVAGLACLRGPACAAAQPDARRALGELARLVRVHPIDSSVRDANGQSRPVHVDEGVLFDIAGDQLWSGGELAAAADALARGDTAPVVRLASELPASGGDFGDPAQFSAGDQAAASCNDLDFVWNRTDPVSVRAGKYRRALAKLDPAGFAPFSKQASVNHVPGPEACLRWPAPDRFVPAVPPGATVRGVPALILSGDQDTNVPTSNTKALLKVFPNAHFVPVAGAGHPTAANSGCARTVIQDFVSDPHGAVGSCTTPENVAPAVPQFPLTADHAIPATPLPGDAATKLDHRIATVGVRTVLDAWLRSFRVADQGQGTGVGLRGGTFGFTFLLPTPETRDHAGMQLDGARFTRDVAVSGGSDWAYATTNELRLQVSVTGPHGQSGTLTATGTYGFNRPYQAFTVTGSLGGHSVNVTVPAT